MATPTPQFSRLFAPRVTCVKAFAAELKNPQFWPLFARLSEYLLSQAMLLAVDGAMMQDASLQGSGSVCPITLASSLFLLPLAYRAPHEKEHLRQACPATVTWGIVPELAKR